MNFTRQINKSFMLIGGNILNNQIRRIMSIIFSYLLITTLFLLVLSLNPFHAVASVLEATAPRVNVLELPTPVITGIDAKNSIIQLKADGYINDNAELVATVALVNEGGGLVDAVEKKVSDPDNIRVSFRTEQIEVGNVIMARFVNHGIGGGEADHIHDTPEPDEVPPLPAQVIIERGGGSSSTIYVVTQADSEQVIVEKIVETETETGLGGVINNIPVYTNSIDTTRNSEEATASEAEKAVISSEDATIWGEISESAKIDSGTDTLKMSTVKMLFILIILLIVISAVLTIFAVFVAKYFSPHSFDDIQSGSPQLVESDS